MLALGASEVVIEARVDRWPDGDLRAREQTLHRVRHHVRSGVANHLQTVRIARADRLERRVRGDGREQIDDFASGTDGNYVIGELSALLEELTRRQARWPRGLRHAHAVAEQPADVGVSTTGDVTSSRASLLRARPQQPNDMPNETDTVGAGGIEPSTPTVSR